MNALRVEPWISTPASSGDATLVSAMWWISSSRCLGDDELLRHGQDLGHGRRLGERAVRRGGLAQEGVQGGGVPGLHRVDGERGGEDLLRLDPAGLAEVRRGAEVLDLR